jgi:hypothetical protein
LFFPKYGTNGVCAAAAPTWPTMSVARSRRDAGPWGEGTRKRISRYL